MATWDQLAQYARDNYAAARHVSPGRMTVDVRCDLDGEFHPVSLRHSAMRGSQDHDWVVMQSPIADVGAVDPLRVTARAGGYMIGGVVSDDEFIYLRHATPLPELTAVDFDYAMDSVGSVARKIGSWLSGAYRY